MGDPVAILSREMEFPQRKRGKLVSYPRSYRWAFHDSDVNIASTVDKF